jgi:hypothetical protein
MDTCIKVASNLSPSKMMGIFSVSVDTLNAMHFVLALYRKQKIGVGRVCGVSIVAIKSNNPCCLHGRCHDRLIG